MKKRKKREKKIAMSHVLQIKEREKFIKGVIYFNHPLSAQS
jgi:hypothetical protein